MPCGSAASPARPTAPSHTLVRALGALGVLGAPGMLLMWDPPAKTDLRANLLMSAYLIGWARSAVAMRRLRVTGRGRGAAFLALGLAVLTSRPAA